MCIERLHLIKRSINCINRQKDKPKYFAFWQIQIFHVRGPKKMKTTLPDASHIGCLFYPKVTFSLKYWANNGCGHYAIAFLLFRRLSTVEFSFFFVAEISSNNESNVRSQPMHAFPRLREFYGGDQVLPPTRWKLPSNRKINRAGAFKFHTDSPVELITSISLPLGLGATSPANFPNGFRPYNCARYLNYPPVTSCNCNARNNRSDHVAGRSTAPNESTTERNVPTARLVNI